MFYQLANLPEDSYQLVKSRVGAGAGVGGEAGNKGEKEDITGSPQGKRIEILPRIYNTL